MASLTRLLMKLLIFNFCLSFSLSVSPSLSFSVYLSLCVCVCVHVCSTSVGGSMAVVHELQAGLKFLSAGPGLGSR